MNRTFHTFMFISLSLLASVMLMILPLAKDLHWLRPHWVMLVLIYWIVFLPNYVGVWSAFICGLILDLLGGHLLGAMGLNLAIVAYVAVLLQSKLRVFRIWQQIVLILGLIGLSQVMRFIMQMSMGMALVAMHYWSSCLVSMICWPLIYFSLKAYQETFKLS